MKKIILLLLAAVLLFSLAACGGEGSDTAEVPSLSGSADPSAVPEQETGESPDPGVDVDLTVMNSNMVYSQVYAMVNYPEEYIGKTVKMRGYFNAMDGIDGSRCMMCVVQDATACCEQGLEFELSGDYQYPEDYPEPGTDITVTGTFDTYEQMYNGNGYLYLVLRDAVMA